MGGTLGPILVGMYTCHPCTVEVEVGASRVQSQPELHETPCVEWLLPVGQRPLSVVSPQGFPEKAAAAECSEGDAEKLCRLPQAQELAVVEAVHQGEGGLAYARLSSPGSGRGTRFSAPVCWSPSYCPLPRSL